MPRTLGPYSNAVRAGDFLFVSGQVGLRSSGEPAGPDFATEARQAFANLADTLRAAGSGMDRVVKVAVCLTQADTLAIFFELFASAFPNKPPAYSCIIAQLPYGLSISIECVALA
jgi:2-iminobutanoate/2-iminopropanoate deaminase